MKVQITRQGTWKIFQATNNIVKSLESTPLTNEAWPKTCTPHTHRTPCEE